MRMTVRLLLAVVFLLAVVRAVEYCGYVSVQSQSPFDAHYLESAMVHFAWRVQHGIRLYPDWESYPHVANFFSPLSFLIIGLVGRALGTDIRGLYLVGRGVSIVSVVATSIVLGVVLKRRYGVRAAIFGMLLSLGGCPLYAAGVMTRPDALAEFLGMTGFFLAEGRSRSTGIAAGLMLCLAAMTKQTTLVYFGAAAISLYLKGQWRRALILIAGVTTTILVTVAVVQRLIEMADTLKLDGLEEVLSPELAGQWREIMTSLPFSEHHIEITDIVAEDDRVAIRLKTSGVHSGEWEGVPPTGKRWTNTGMAFFRLSDGKVVADESLFDELGHLKQLGATVAPPST